MPTAEARIATDRASRYITQLCRHLGQMNRASHRPHDGHGQGPGQKMPAVQHVDCTDTHGTVRFADGRWTLDATPDALTLRVDADDDAALRRLQDGITTRIEKIGRRDGLRVRWHADRADSGPGPQIERPPGSEAPTAAPGHGPRKSTWVLAVGAALVVALHLGMGGAALTDAKWTLWTADTVLVLVLLKLLVTGGHLLLGRSALRRGLASRRRKQRGERTDAHTVG
ncbi:DUF2218 domain-containing protein [Actinacidiphila bryophytorum]|uniref:DUF2218 domain-containing protein n=1 Tax=Actinacidiphila bryophytorum TaxID=1436133 RepID=A0A9W4E836_9ACTN|nr:DUF2218 domain-containing protein [Actinacidiphila bryophytorum]MBM9438437.1 DUF2218 domain-containing protein [Actinacidiphila bryophytorum]MBN6545836.1 DUF2218 domain-containing protein [Actinacidiphila bryophytorum]CAG7613550.1 conserved hypothetical protein [Actinacidiphila bryophytorum]